MKIHDVSVTVFDGMPVIPGDPAVSIKRSAMVEDGSQCNLSLYTMGSHTGTHVDAPYHFFEGGLKADSLPLEVLIGPALVVDAGGDELDGMLLEGISLAGVERVLFKNFAGMTEEAAGILVRSGVRLVGVDCFSVERETGGGYPVHRALLGGGVVIVECLDLSNVGPGVYEMICLPLKVKDGDGAPARVVLRDIP